MSRTIDRVEADSTGTGVQDKMSEGTSLEDIESGNVAYTADTDAMNAILSDMNAVEEAPVYNPPAPEFQLPPPPPQPQYQPQYQPEPSFPTQFPQFPQMQIHEMQSQQQPQPTYEKVEAPVHATKKNSWSLLFDDMRDPLVVGLLVTFFSLPALHTWLAKRLTWAYKVGGSLSWVGFLLQFAIVGGLFITYRQIMKVVDGTA